MVSAFVGFGTSEETAPIRGDSFSILSEDDSESETEDNPGSETEDDSGSEKEDDSGSETEDDSGSETPPSLPPCNGWEQPPPPLPLIGAVSLTCQFLFPKAL